MGGGRSHVLISQWVHTTIVMRIINRAYKSTEKKLNRILFGTQLWILVIPQYLLFVLYEIYFSSKEDDIPSWCTTFVRSKIPLSINYSKDEPSLKSYPIHWSDYDLTIPGWPWCWTQTFSQLPLWCSFHNTQTSQCQHRNIWFSDWIKISWLLSRDNGVNEYWTWMKLHFA